ncbi:hypothetical protein ACLI4Q_10895 [Natrialbaceae archaeon A-CW1-1]
MVSVVGVRFLHEYRDDPPQHFPDTELTKLRSAIEAVDESVFFETGSKNEVKLDEEMASHLNSYAPKGKTEHQLWDESNHSVDLYNVNERIAVEIEKTEQKNIWKNLIKFSRGKEGGIDYGCVVVPENYTTSRRELNLFAHAQRALKFTSPLIPIDDIAVIGYHDPR